MQDVESFCVGDAVTQFFVTSAPKDPGAAQQVLQKFVRWYGRERLLREITPWEVESFGQNSGADSIAKLQPVKAFLAYAHKEGMTELNLGSHLKVKRSPARARQVKRAATIQAARLSPEGFDRVKRELENLTGQRQDVAQEIKRAMADKDFRENAPLDAARDQQAHLEARIRELESTLRYAEIVDGSGQGRIRGKRSRLGSRLVVRELEDDEEVTYTLVDPNEVDLAAGKISVNSPTGQAFMNRSAGDNVEVQAPVGAIHYRIEQVEA